MAVPVWTLSVDLQTKTATFVSGLGDAAKGARGSFQDIKDGAADMGRSTSGSMMEARHGVTLLGEEFGVHLPRALTSFIASIGPIGAAMEAAFPFLAILVGATLLIQHLAKLRAEGEKLTESQVQFGTTVANVLNGWNDKLIEAGIKTDELNGNHLGALNKQLELIDRQSLNELVKSFDTVAKAADVTFAQLQTHWYQWGAGSAGAKNSLEQFKTQYESLQAQGKDKEATALLDAKIEREQKILALQKEASSTKATGPGGAGEADAMKFYQARTELQKLSVGYDEDAVKSQQTQVGALASLVDLEAKRAAYAKAEKGNATQVTENKMEGDGDKVARAQAQQERQAAEDAQKLWEENYRAAVSALQESEKEKIDATRQGSSARLAAIDAAIKEEQSKGLQDTGFYKSLLTDRVNTARQMSEEQSKIQAEAGKQDAETGLKMDQLRIANEREQSQLMMSLKRTSAQERVNAAVQLANEEFTAEMIANQKLIAALDKNDKDRENKLAALQSKQVELIRAHENQVTEIRTKAEEERNARLLSAEHRADDEVARSATQALMGRMSAAKMLISIGDQVAAGMMESAIKSVLANDYTKESDAAAAARKAYLAGMKFPFPANIVMGPLLGAMAFASVMAFQDGGLVPGVGSGDIVSARLEPGETVLTKKLTEGLTNQARSGNMDGGGETHFHHHVTNHIHAIDGASVRGMLTKHADEFERHVTNHLRKQNR